MGATLLVAGENPRPPALNDNPECYCKLKVKIDSLKLLLHLYHVQYMYVNEKS